MESQWMTPRAVRKQLGVSEDTLRRWSNAGKLPSYATPGGQARYRREDIENAYVKKAVSA